MVVREGQGYGFNQGKPSINRRQTPYDMFIGKDIRVDAAGQGYTGRLESCEVCSHGYSFSIKPHILYGPNGAPEIKSNMPALLTSNGSPVSIHQVEEGLEAHVREISNAIKERKKESSNPDTSK